MWKFLNFCVIVESEFVWIYNFWFTVFLVLYFSFSILNISYTVFWLTKFLLRNCFAIFLRVPGLWWVTFLLLSRFSCICLYSLITKHLSVSFFGCILFQVLWFFFVFIFVFVYLHTSLNVGHFWPIFLQIISLSFSCYLSFWDSHSMCVDLLDVS